MPFEPSTKFFDESPFFTASLPEQLEPPNMNSGRVRGEEKSEINWHSRGRIIQLIP